MYKKYLFNVVFAVGLLTICTVSFAQKSEYKKLLKGDPDVSALEEFAKQFPNFAPVYFKIGDHYHLNDKDKAIEYYEKALSMMSDDETDENKKFYEDYEQRDFRSGKVMVKTSFLRQYLEERIQKNKE